ncbi:MAG: helix-turn-helix domain-containing protein [Candidatus Adiutrix sp.]|jgi:hypothetical protein|nr:helix-turn-helix domain-containing protein [Candidatus Adiutrix sp.]
MEQAETFLSRKEAAEFLKMSEIFLAKDIVTRRHRVPYMKFGRSVRYRLADLEAWALRQRVDPAAGAKR